MSEVVLKNKQEFINVLTHYQPSDEAMRLLQKIPLVILLGVTGAGRNTIINHLLGMGNYHFVVSDTTRPPKLRDGKMEEHGVNYYFRSEEDILDDLEQGRFLEAELIHNQQVSGINIRELQAAAVSGKVPINEIDLGGTVAVRKAKPDTMFFFIMPPNFKEWRYRLLGREVMSDQELTNRFMTAKTVISEALAREDFVFVVNESSHESAIEIDTYVKHTQVVGDQHHARQLAHELLQDLEDYLISSTH